ncbi:MULTISPECIES: hypothetical protein [Thermococcus]|uniref:Uncharacterized protein n=2 Tax=Thermococcus sibiricus TaxID=172049 RepID=C6A4D4_THESM|nr:MULTISPECIES: hypothetical protein [Thermococcus]KUK28238.1 MAG: Uncharacterized protein XD61_1225 [Thermococcus sp. 40_45]HII66410.1 hypothetical protein [Thermococcaceae archaeon]ACS90479.1 hypothetical protein TSIB_1428 [Thermococcus sibiricus MM 739]KUK18003.1 MAG: Uncharacterized protein XD54_0730 [Thermococcus sibiricus]MBC7095598.1 hypothetical protein [Thermococcus sp.]
MEPENIHREDRFMIYNVMGKSIMVETYLNEKFKFICPIEECGENIEIEGVIKIVSLEEYKQVLKETVKKNKEFEVIKTLNPTPLIFDGTVNGKRVKLPAESVQSLAKRFVDTFLNL